MIEELKIILSNQENYRQMQLYRDQILLGDKMTIQDTLFTIASILRDLKSDPMLQLQAVRMSKDCIETFNDDFITQFQFEVLPLFETIALFDKASDNPDRGLKYFGSNNPFTQKIGNSLLRLVQECIWVWAKWFPIDPESLKVSCYRITLEKIFRLQVSLPSLTYFNVKKVRLNMPGSQMPIKVLEELRKAVKIDLHQTYGAGSNAKIIQQRLSQLLPVEMQRPTNEQVFYSDLFRKAWKKAVKESIQNSKVAETVVVKQQYIPERRPVSQQHNQLSHQIELLQSDLLANLKDKQVMSSTIKEQQQTISFLQAKLEILQQQQQQQSQIITAVPSRYIQTNGGMVLF